MLTSVTLEASQKEVGEAEQIHGFQKEQIGPIQRSHNPVVIVIIDDISPSMNTNSVHFMSF